MAAHNDYTQRVLEAAQTVMLHPFGLSHVEVCTRSNLTRAQAVEVLDDLVAAGWVRADVLDDAQATRDTHGRFQGSIPGNLRWVIEPKLLLRLFRAQKRFFLSLESLLSTGAEHGGRAPIGELKLRELAREPVAEATYRAWVRAVEKEQ